MRKGIFKSPSCWRFFQYVVIMSPLEQDLSGPSARLHKIFLQTPLWSELKIKSELLKQILLQMYLAVL